MPKHNYRAAAALLVLLAATGFVYAPGLGGPFVFDDLTNILQVPAIRITDLTFDSLVQAWYAREFDALKRPLAMLSFAINYYFTQFDVFYFKLTNLVIHFAVGVALYVLTLALLRRQRVVNPEGPYQAEQLPWLALAIAGIWLLHPLNLTSVLYVAQRMTSLSALFTVLGLVGYCRGREQIIQGSAFGLLTIVLSLALFGGLAVLCKENGVLLLPLAGLIELAFYRFAAERRLQGVFWKLWLAIIVLPVLIAVTVVLADFERWFGAGAYRFRDFTLEERVLTQTRAIWFYIRLVFLPDATEMGLYHDNFSISRGLLEPRTTLLAIIGIVGILGAAIAARKRWPVFSFGVLWFAFGHSLESTVLALELVHEHRNYLPQYGLLFFSVYVVAAPWSNPAVRRTLRLRLGFLGLIAVLLGAVTYARSLQWHDEGNLYTLEVTNHPDSARSHTMLGAWMYTHGLYEGARRHLTIAANLAPHKIEHLIRLVQIVYVSEGKMPQELLEILRHRLASDHPSGVTLWVFQPLLRVTRNDVDVHTQMLDIYTMVVGRPDIHFMNLQYEAAYSILAEEHAFRGNVREALQYYDRARSINPRPRYALASARLYAKGGCAKEAQLVVTRLRERAKLSRADEEQLQEVRALLNDIGPSTSGCTL